jgi:hypothetical protein
LRTVFWTLSIVRIKYKYKMTTFRKMVLLPPSVEGRADTYSVGSFWPS